jgi:hypothetical protein
MLWEKMNSMERSGEKEGSPLNPDKICIMEIIKEELYSVIELKTLAQWESICLV